MPRDRGKFAGFTKIYTRPGAKRRAVAALNRAYAP